MTGVWTLPRTYWFAKPLPACRFSLTKLELDAFTTLLTHDFPGPEATLELAARQAVNNVLENTSEQFLDAISKIPRPLEALTITVTQRNGPTHPQIWVRLSADSSYVWVESTDQSWAISKLNEVLNWCGLRKVWYTPLVKDRRLIAIMLFALIGFPLYFLVVTPFNRYIMDPTSLSSLKWWVWLAFPIGIAAGFLSVRLSSQLLHIVFPSTVLAETENDGSRGEQRFVMLMAAICAVAGVVAAAFTALPYFYMPHR